MKVAICGTWHVHATDYAKVALETEGVEVVGFYEETPVHRDSFASKFDIKAFDSFEELLASDADGVIVCTSTDVHADYMVKIAQAKKDIFTEKILAFTVEECEQIKKAVEENGVRFVISLFQKFRSGIRAVKKVADSGELGRINFVRFRNSHAGSTGGWLPQHFFNKKECGGGAMIDLGAHGMYLIEWLLGLPSSYMSSFTVWDNNEKNTDKLEDNAVTVMTYDDGTIAINETAFVTLSTPSSFEVSGDRGFVRYTAGEGVVKSTKDTERRIVKVEEDGDLPLPIEQFLTGKTVDGCGMDDAINLTKMMIGAYDNIN